MPFPPPGDLPDPGTKPASPVLAGRSFTTEAPGKPPILTSRHSFSLNSQRTKLRPQSQVGLRKVTHRKWQSWNKNSKFCSVQSLSRVQLFATPWTAAHQPSPSITNSWNLLKLMCIKSVMPSNPLILCRPLLLPRSIFPSIRVFSNESVLCICGPSIGVSASASDLPMCIQD